MPRSNVMEPMRVDVERQTASLAGGQIISTLHMEGVVWRYVPFCRVRPSRPSPPERRSSFAEGGRYHPPCLISSREHGIPVSALHFVLSFGAAAAAEAVWLGAHRHSPFTIHMPAAVD
jgi:hypothetical protein